MSSAPDITFRSAVAPFNILSGLPYVQTAPSGAVLPVLQGEFSDKMLFRIYNNFALNSGVASATNIKVTVYDGAGAGSHTCAILPVSHSWVCMVEYGYGENSVTSPDRFTSFVGSDLAIGGSSPCGSNYYVPEFGSDGSSIPQIRAFSSGNGMGYIEFQTYIRAENSGVPNQDYNFAVSMSYDWTP